MSASKVVDLRVHGVSGTPPKQLLDCPLVSQIAGERKACFETVGARAATLPTRE
jgi:hypothetical protein